MLINCRNRNSILYRPTSLLPSIRMYCWANDLSRPIAQYIPRRRHCAILTPEVITYRTYTRHPYYSSAAHSATTTCSVVNRLSALFAISQIREAGVAARTTFIISRTAQLTSKVTVVSSYRMSLMPVRVH